MCATGTRNDSLGIVVVRYDALENVIALTNTQTYYKYLVVTDTLNVYGEASVRFFGNHMAVVCDGMAAKWRPQVFCNLFDL
jgi:hypothetical protein